MSILRKLLFLMVVVVAVTGCLPDNSSKSEEKADDPVYNIRFDNITNGVFNKVGSTGYIPALTDWIEYGQVGATDRHICVMLWISYDPYLTGGFDPPNADAWGMCRDVETIANSVPVTCTFDGMGRTECAEIYTVLQFTLLNYDAMREMRAEELYLLRAIARDSLCKVPTVDGSMCNTQPL